MGIFNQNRGTTSSSAASTLIAKGCSVSGELKVENDVQIDGIVDGQINVEGTLVVAESGRVNGEIYAKQLIINGMMDGNCHAEHIQVLAKGRVSGRIWSNNLSIEPGGKFFGEAAELPEKEVVTLKGKAQENASTKENNTNNEKRPARKSA
ncbi:bactofilin family protein [Vibrio diabolicus]|uniref:Polymer-forming cytoskeletal family protein n=1 Tax=Vibrio diabolicus TaxID=50719 RepID=A0ABN5HPS0_9VIBR|nr:polymer-forming cytoskeletal protein [Vibrio diabolicus]AVH29022.1 polymer-forming cytoskeletal family protein [Vibrio diabolicus]